MSLVVASSPLGHVWALIHNLTGEQLDQGLALADDLPPDEVEALVTEAEGLGMVVGSRADLAELIHRAVYQRRAAFASWDPGVDIARLAAGWTLARDGGYSFIIGTREGEASPRRPLLGNGEIENGSRSRIRVRSIDVVRALADLTAIYDRDLEERIGTIPKPISIRALAEATSGTTFKDLTDCANAWEIKPPSQGGSPLSKLVSELETAAAVYLRALKIHRLFSPDWAPSMSISPGTYADRLLTRFGLQPRLVLQPGFSRSELSGWAGAYFNGEVFCQYRGRDLPIASLDFGGLYVAVHQLTGAWELQSALRVRVYNRDPEQITRYLARLARRIKRWLKQPSGRPPLSPRDWRRLTRTLVYIRPRGDVLPHRVNINPEDPSSETRLVVGPLYPLDENLALPFVLADVLRSVLETGSIPEIVSATRLVPWGQQQTQPVALSEGLTLDPSDDNPFFQLAEHRIRLGHSRPADPTLKRTRDLIKGVTTAGVGGQPVQALDDEPTKKPRPIHYWNPLDREEGPALGLTRVMETPGRWYEPYIAAGVTAAARLLLYIARSRFEHEGAAVAYWDTDSLLVTATPLGGGLIPMPGGDHEMPDGRQAIRSVSFATVHKVRAQLEVFSPYPEDTRPYAWTTTPDGTWTKTTLPSFLKREPENEPAPESWGLPVPNLRADIIRSKRYQPFQVIEPGPQVHITEHGPAKVEASESDRVSLSEVVMRSPSRHGVTYAPLGEHPADWENQLRSIHIAEHLGLQTRPVPAWAQLPAVSVLPATRPALTELHPALGPFDHAGVVTGPFGGSAIAKLDTNPNWIDFEHRQPVTITTNSDPDQLGGSLPVKSTDLAIRMNTRAPEPWALTTNGDPVRPGTQGKLQPAPTTATEVRLIGKEGRRWRDSRNILPGTDVTTYTSIQDQQAVTALLRDRYSWRGAAAHIAATTGLPHGTVKAFLAGRQPSQETYRRLIRLLSPIT